MNDSAVLEGSARLLLIGNVVPMDPQAAVADAMLEGWARQQRVRFLKDKTIKGRIDLVSRLMKFSNLYPWQWTAGEVEAFFDDLRCGRRPITVSTARNYQVDLRMFLNYVTDTRYGWPEVCQQRFGQVPEQVLHEENTLTHTDDFEGRPGRRPLTYDEVQALLDAADGRVEQIRARHRKGALAAHRNAALLRVVYAYGIRRREAWGLDLHDLRRNPKAKQYGRVGGIFVRWGKSSRGGQPKRRTVLTVPEMDWVVPAINQWIDEVRPGFHPGQHPAIWVTERRGRLSLRGINEAFEQARTDAGLDEDLELHCLRHSYITHLTEFGYPERFVQDQAGHRYGATTAIYTNVSDEYRNRILTRVLRDQHGDDLYPQEATS